MRWDKWQRGFSWEIQHWWRPFPFVTLDNSFLTVSTFPSPIFLSSLCNTHTLEHSEIIHWVHSYNFYLLKPYIFVIIVQYAYSRTFCIYKLSLLFTTFKLLKPYIFITIVKYACSRTFSPLQAMKYVLVFHHNYAIPGRIKRPPFRSRFSLGFTGRTTTTLLTRFLYIFILEIQGASRPSF